MKKNSISKIGTGSRTHIRDIPPAGGVLRNEQLRLVVGGLTGQSTPPAADEPPIIRH